MNLSNPSHRTLLLALAGALGLGVLALVVAAAVALWHLTEWGSGAISKVTDATVAAVAPFREDAARAIADAKGAAVTTAAAVALSREEAAGALEEAKASIATTRERAAQALAQPQVALQRAADDAATDLTRSLAAAALAVAPVVSQHADSAARSLNALASRDPQAWPAGLALKQTHVREVGEMTEYAYVASEPTFQLAQLREQLRQIVYTEQVTAEGEGWLEAVYRGERQLLLSATTREGLQHIDVREVPLAEPAKSGS